ncbi:MAG: 50S ribosomal protein L4 [Methanosarcinales archaeon]|nr:MAG: 50S ribosomal protein L4 [Methanosarcinales archaeon]
MKSNVLSLSGSPLREIELPDVFSEAYRPDIIKRAVVAAQANRRQPYGVSAYAGMRTSARSLGSGRGIAQIPRLVNSNQAARVPQTKGGRRAHPPKAEKDWTEKINQKERRLAIRSAIAATTNPELVAARGHRVEADVKLPIIVEDAFESLTKTSEVCKVLELISVWDDVVRAKDGKKIRAGRGKLRGRKYKKPKSVLIVASDYRGIEKAARNISGVDIITCDRLNTEMLAPGTHAGRLIVWTESAISKLE